MMMCELAWLETHFALSIHDWYSGGFTVQKIEHQRSKCIQHCSEKYSRKCMFISIQYQMFPNVCMHANRGVQKQENSHLKSRNQRIFCVFSEDVTLTNQWVKKLPIHLPVDRQVIFAFLISSLCALPVVQRHKHIRCWFLISCCGVTRFRTKNWT